MMSSRSAHLAGDGSAAGAMTPNVGLSAPRQPALGPEQLVSSPPSGGAQKEVQRPALGESEDAAVSARTEAPTPRFAASSGQRQRPAQVWARREG